MLVSYHIEDTVCAGLYYGYGGSRKSGDYAFYFRKIEDRMMRLTPDTVLVHVEAKPEVIRDRMRTAPHEHPLAIRRRRGDGARTLSRCSCCLRHR